MLVVMVIKVMVQLLVAVVEVTVLLEQIILAALVLLEGMEEIIIGAQDQTSLMVVEVVAAVPVLVVLVVLVDLVAAALDKLKDPCPIHPLVVLAH
jgi:hypothetical protein|tara:strand:+ start:398 stop:682 length:285 start_codon:yes stop_codon:yes gene_type:complete